LRNAGTETRRVAAIEDELGDVVDDEVLWRHQARTFAVARAATYGAVDTVLVDIDQVMPGTIDEETGAVSFAQSSSSDRYGVVDEIARRTWLAGGTVLAVRRDDVPGHGAAAAILRYRIG
jgi:hypothetical protein